MPAAKFVPGSVILRLFHGGPAAATKWVPWNVACCVPLPASLHLPALHATSPPGQRAVCGRTCVVRGPAVLHVGVQFSLAETCCRLWLRASLCSISAGRTADISCTHIIESYMESRKLSLVSSMAFTAHRRISAWATQAMANFQQRRNMQAAAAAALQGLSEDDSAALAAAAVAAPFEDLLL